MSQIGTLFIGNDNDLLLDNLSVVSSGGGGAGATVTAKVFNGATAIAGSSVTLTATTGSNDYKGVLSSTVPLTANSKVKIVYNVTSSSGATGRFVHEARVRVREK